MNEENRELHDVIIVGAGPGGLAAGIYAARARLKTVILEKGLPGGQVLMTWKVENYPGWMGGTAQELAALLEKHARMVGCGIIREEALEVREAGEVREVVTDAGVRRARAVIVAAGARPNPLGIPGEREYVGRGVSYCATCDAPFFQGMPVAVVGGGDAAVEEADFLTRFASRVFLIHRRDRLRAVKWEQDQLMSKPNAAVVWNTVVEEVLGDGKGVTGVRIKNVQTGEPGRLDVQGVFIFVGISPNSGLVRGKVEMDQWGFIKTDEYCRTSMPGVFAVGDIRSKEMRQIVNAVGEGATAAWFLERNLRR